jgi:hypothetical protein
MQMEDRSLMYESGDVWAHFTGVSIFLEAATQHAACEKEEVIYCPCKVCNNNMIYLYRTQHATREKEEAIYCPCKVCNNNMMYMYTDHEIIQE